MSPPREKKKADATWDDLMAVPEHLTGEIVEGELVVHPRPGSPHIVVASDLAGVLVGAFRFGNGGGPGGWVIVNEPGLRFGRDIRSPDIAGWRRARWPAALGTGPIEVVPDWICEVLSPSTRRTDRVEKMPLYARHGVAHLWLVDPAVRTLEVYRREGAFWLQLGVYTEGDVRAEPFDAIALPLDRVFELLPPAPGDEPP